MRVQFLSGNILRAEVVVSDWATAYNMDLKGCDRLIKAAHLSRPFNVPVGSEIKSSEIVGTELK